MFCRKKEDLGNPVYVLNLSYNSSEGVIPIGIAQVTGEYVCTDKWYLLRIPYTGLPVKEGTIDADTFIEYRGDFTFFYNIGEEHHLAFGKPDKLKIAGCTPEVKNSFVQKPHTLMELVVANAGEISRR